MPELQQYEVNVYPNCKESLYVTAEFPPYCRSNSVKDPSQAPVNQVASKPIFPHQLIPLPLKPSKPLNHKLALSSSGQCTPETNVASKPIVAADSPRASSSKKQRRIYSNLSDLKLSPSTASSSSPLFEFRNGIQYELAPIEYFDKTITPPPCSSPSPTTSGRTLSGPKKSFVTQVASKPIHPAQLCPRPLSSPPVVAAAPISGPVLAPAFAATGLPFAAGALGCTGRALSTPPPILPTVGIRDLYGVGGLPLRPSVGVSPFIGRGFNCGSPALPVPLGLPLNLGCHAPLSAPISGLFPRTLGPICQQTVGAPLALPAPAISARTPLPIMPVPVQGRCGVGAVPALPPCAAPCPRPCLPPCPPPCPPPRPLPCPPPPSGNIIIGGSDGRCDRKCLRQPECRGAVRLGKLCAGCCKKTQVFLGPPFIPQRRPFC